MNTTVKTLLLSSALLGSSAFAAPLTYKTYNPQSQGIFPVSSTLIAGDKDAILVDGQFSVKDGANLVKMIQDSGKNLTHIVITAGDPDYYFGLEPIVKAFPNAQVVATPEVVKHIQDTKDGKLAYWGPILKDGAPQQIIVPTALKGNTLKVDGQKVEIKAPGSYASYLWVPSNRTVLGGVGISSGIHVWTADTQTPESRKEWVKVLNKIERSHPKAVIPGHYLGAIPEGRQAVSFTAQYLKDYEKILNANKDKGSAAVVAAVKEKYPSLGEEASLELSSKVHTGEMKW
ncbi:Vmh family MBL fold metallo-hydrolase [Acinetobacter sp. MD2]|uniref:Vmh family MBL fold metallo-hydrolase n=1 Tax=Acinetobacter sp. MD2 TaxID=2600066 RepID=UPI002D1F1C78|nr:Vmh family MBL fold metallo-hydrolase [Acinetobacter sp. MD2]MEB3766349.1 MBL fold metallo-hydrolase [Acinetobacter sp. MD2]